MDIWIKSATIQNVNISIKRDDSDEEEVLELQGEQDTSPPCQIEDAEVIEEEPEEKSSYIIDDTEDIDDIEENDISRFVPTITPDKLEEVIPEPPQEEEIEEIHEILEVEDTQEIEDIQETQEIEPPKPVIEEIIENIPEEPAEEILSQDVPAQEPIVLETEPVIEKREIFVDYNTPPIFSQMPPQMVHEMISEDMRKNGTAIPVDPVSVKTVNDIEEVSDSQPPDDVIDVTFTQTEPAAEDVIVEEIEKVEEEPAKEIEPEIKEPEVVHEMEAPREIPTQKQEEAKEIVNNVRFRNPLTNLFITWDEKTQSVIMDKNREGDPAQSWNLEQLDKDDASPIPRFTIKNQLTGGYLVYKDHNNTDLDKKGSFKNRDIITDSYQNSLEFQWIFVPIPPNTSTDNVLIINNKSKLVCDIYLHQVVPGTKLVQYSFRGGNNQLFTLEKV